MQIRSAVHEILADKAFTATDGLISQSFVVTLVPPTYVQIALIWGFLVQRGLGKSVHWLWRYKLNEVYDILEVTPLWGCSFRTSGLAYDISALLIILVSSCHNNSYIPSCTDYMWNKGNTSKLVGLLYSLPVSDSHFNSINIDFIGPLPTNKGYNMLITITD